MYYEFYSKCSLLSLEILKFNKKIQNGIEELIENDLHILSLLYTYIQLDVSFLASDTKRYSIGVSILQNATTGNKA